MSLKALGLIPALLSLLLIPGESAAAAHGLWDPGFRNAGWRSDFDDPELGTAVAPLAFSSTCAYPEVSFALCPTAFSALPGVAAPPDRYARSNWRDTGTDAHGRFWVVGANTEPALHAPCNSGPPNQSEGVAEPNEDVFGLAIEPEHDGVRPDRSVLRMAVDLRHRPNQLADRPDCTPIDFIPYLGFGVDAGRGAGVAELARIGGGEPEVVWKFMAALESSDAASFDPEQGPPERPKGQHAGVLIEAQWNGHRRWVWIELFNTYDRAEESYFTPWNWAVPASFHFPGAEIAVTSAQALALQCPEFHGALPSTAPAAWSDQAWLAVRIPLEALFRCVGSNYSTPFPVDVPVVVTGLQFWVEVGVRDIDGVSGISASDYASHLNMAFADVDLLPEGLPVLDDIPSLVRQLSSGLLMREPGAEEAERLAAMATESGAPALISHLLDHREAAGSLGLATRLQLLGWGQATDYPRLRRHAVQLAQAPLGRLLAAEVASDPRFAARWPGPWDEVAVLGLLHAAHAPTDNASALRLQELAVQWSGRLRRGLASIGDLLWVATRESYDSADLNATVRVVKAYTGLLRRLPTNDEIRVATLDGGVAEALYWSSEFRSRFLPEPWSTEPAMGSKFILDPRDPAPAANPASLPLRVGTALTH